MVDQLARLNHVSSCLSHEGEMAPTHPHGAQRANFTFTKPSGFLQASMAVCLLFLILLSLLLTLVLLSLVTVDRRIGSTMVMTGVLVSQVMAGVLKRVLILLISINIVLLRRAIRRAGRQSLLLSPGLGDMPVGVTAGHATNA